VFYFCFNDGKALDIRLIIMNFHRFRLLEDPEVHVPFQKKESHAGRNFLSVRRDVETDSLYLVTGIGAIFDLDLLCFDTDTVIFVFTYIGSGLRMAR
jgi:hypothetical protein